MPRLEGKEGQGLLGCLQWKGEKNRGQDQNYIVKTRPAAEPAMLKECNVKLGLTLGWYYIYIL